MKIKCRTLFDCSRTGITGRFRSSQLPFTDESGQTITTLDDWNRGRNQQRNWETLLQIVGLRAQPQEIVYPVEQDQSWTFEFMVESEGVYGLAGSDDPFAALRQDAQNIPMLTGLGECPDLEPRLHTQGPGQNIWFETINTALD